MIKELRVLSTSRLPGLVSLGPSTINPTTPFGPLGLMEGQNPKVEGIVFRAYVRLAWNAGQGPRTFQQLESLQNVIVHVHMHIHLYIYI